MADPRFRSRHRQGIDVDAAAVRRARLEAGLSLAQVAAGCGISRQHVHHIENGRARPRPSVLHDLARVLDKPVESLVVRRALERPLEVEVAELGIVVSQQRYEEAVARGASILERPLGLPELTEVHYQMGLALLQSHQPEKAVPHLEAASGGARQLLDEGLLVSCMDLTAAARFVLDDPGGVSMAEEALRRCEAMQPVPVQVRASILGHLGFMYMNQQRNDEAIDALSAAINEAGTVQDVRTLAMAYHNLVLVYERLGNTVKAVEYAHKAQAVYQLQRDQRFLMWLHEDLGRTLMDAGRLEQSKQHIDAALELGRDIPANEVRGRASITVALAEWHMARSQYAEAQKVLEEALAITEASGELAPRARIHWLFGRLAANRSEEQTVLREYGKAIEIQDKLNLKADLVECHRELGDALARFGQIEEAGRHWREALGLAESGGTLLNRSNYRMASPAG